MNEEMKKYILATYLYCGGVLRKEKSCDEGVRLIDWVRAGAPVDPGRLAVIVKQALFLLRQREQSGEEEVRGPVSPYIFIVDRRGELRLLDLEDESNLAVSRKIRTDSVMRWFCPADMEGCSTSQAELYGLGRMCQFMLACSEEAGSPVTGKAAKRWAKFIAGCTGEAARPFGDLERAAEAFESIPDQTTEKAGRHVGRPWGCGVSCSASPGWHPGICRAGNCLCSTAQHRNRG